MANEERRLARPIEPSGIYLPVVKKEVREPERGPLHSMLAHVVRELGKLTYERDEKDLQEDIRYLRNPENGSLIKVSRRRPTWAQTHSANFNHYIYGYFAEVYQEIDGVPQHTIDDPYEIWDGNFQRVNISDEAVDKQRLGLIPSSFDSTRRRILADFAAEKQLALPEGARQEDVIEQSLSVIKRGDAQKKPVLAELFEDAEESTKQMVQVADRIRSSIDSHFFKMGGPQGFAPDVKGYNLVVSDEGEGSSFLSLSSELGLDPFVLPSWKMVENLDPFVRHVIRQGGDPYEIFPEDGIGNMKFHYSNSITHFREEHGAYPVVTTIDTRPLSKIIRAMELHGVTANLVVNIEREAEYDASTNRKPHPLFAVVQIANETYPKEERQRIERRGNGRYVVFDTDEETVKGLFKKIATDFNLTKQVRGIAYLIQS